MIYTYSVETSSRAKRLQAIRDKQRGVDSSTYRGRWGYFPTPKKAAPLEKKSDMTILEEANKEANLKKSKEAFKKISTKYSGVVVKISN